MKCYRQVAQSERMKSGRPGAETVANALRGKTWYASLDGERWLAAAMMLEFEMRNGDVLRRGEGCFVKRGGRCFHCYTPYKTSLSSGRRVCWPVHESIWARIEDAGGLAAFDVTDDIFRELNRNLRALGFRGSNGAYELRKICFDHVYQKYSAAMAVSISGDDIRTISRYYAAPSRPNIGDVSIIDLFSARHPPRGVRLWRAPPAREL